MIVTYKSNNSGGSWWLSEDDWKALEEAGWNVHWVQEDKQYGGYGRPSGAYSDPMKKFDRVEGAEWLGGVAMSAAIEADSMQEAIDSWRNATGQSPSDLGCSCCGPPHSFSSDEGEYATPSYPTSDPDFQY